MCVCVCVCVLSCVLCACVSILEYSVCVCVCVCVLVRVRRHTPTARIHNIREYPNAYEARERVKGKKKGEKTNTSSNILGLHTASGTVSWPLSPHEYWKLVPVKGTLTEPSAHAMEHDSMYLRVLLAQSRFLV